MSKGLSHRVGVGCWDPGLLGQGVCGAKYAMAAMAAVLDRDSWRDLSGNESTERGSIR